MKDRKEWPRVRERVRIIGGKTMSDWCIDCGKVKGKRHMYFRKSRIEAKQLAARLSNERDRAGELAFALTAEQRLMAAQCFDLLKDSGMTLLEVVQQYCNKRKEVTPDAPRTVSDICSEMQEAGIRQGLRPRSLSTMATWHNLFIKRWPVPIFINDIKSSDIDSYVSEWQDKSAVTRSNMLRYLSAVFAYAVKREYLLKNPCQGIERPKIHKAAPEFLTIPQVKQLLLEASRHKPSLFRVCLGLFAGLRTAEIERLTSDAVNIEARTIRISGDVAKTGTGRVVEISDNLAAWLQVSGLHEWSRDGLKFAWLPHNALRHTFATYHLAHHQDAAYTSLQLGHQGNSRLLFNHYAGLATPAQGKEYWEIKP